MTKARIGDIVEFTLPSGRLAYAQYTHRHEGRPSYGQLIRILPGTYEKRLDDLEALAREPERFYAFYPIDRALRAGDLRLAGHVAVPEWAVSFPRFRSIRGVDPKTRRASHWWLWDGERSTPIEVMTPELAKLSIRGRPTLQYLVSHIESGWKPEDDV